MVKPGLCHVALVALAVALAACSGGGNNNNNGGGGQPPVPGTVNVDASVTGDAVPLGQLVATALIQITDGSTLQSVTWSQPEGVPAVIQDPLMETTPVTLGAATSYKNELLMGLEDPPLDPSQLPGNVPNNPFFGGLQDRWQVVGIDPWSWEHAAAVVLEVTVVTTSGTYHDEVEVHTELPWYWSSGIKNVPINEAVLLYGKDQPAYNWNLMTAPGSAATLQDPVSRSPWFTPDVPGMYTVVVFDSVAQMNVTMEIYAGTWRGVVTGENPATGYPIGDQGCTVCHQGLGAIAGDQFTPWEASGHAEIFKDQLTTGNHWGPGCFPCHSVGYNADADNNGLDDVPTYDDWVNSGLINAQDPTAWTQTLNVWPEVAQRGNIQCENCHGPQNAAPGQGSNAHGIAGPVGMPRVTLSAYLCAKCHGEPPRHGRYQQWQLSGHANYELAIDESQSSNCSRCHTANGFLDWETSGFDPGTNANVTWTEDEAHPQTCQVCHPVHFVGTTSGDNTDAPMRIEGDTPLLQAGYTVVDAGSGAICMTCHNSRRGLRNDNLWPTIAGTTEAFRAPHGPTQTDLLVGQNIYYLTPGIRGAHSFVTDTCSNCHLQLTEPPDIISYNRSGRNHTFYASTEICSECHAPGGVDAGAIQSATHTALDAVEDLLEQAWLKFFTDELMAAPGTTIDLLVSGMVVATITNPMEITEIQFTETRGRQALDFTLTTQLGVVGPIRVQDIDIVPPAPALPFAAYTVTPDVLGKSGWNWIIVHGDGSYGIHYPSLAQAILATTVSQLQAYVGP